MQMVGVVRLLSLPELDPRKELTDSTDSALTNPLKGQKGSRNGIFGQPKVRGQGPGVCEGGAGGLDSYGSCQKCSISSGHP